MKLLDDLNRATFGEIVVSCSDDSLDDFKHDAGFTKVTSPPGRGAQIAGGIANATCPWIWVLHADTRVPHQALRAFEVALEETDVKWGAFKVRITGNAKSLRVIASMMNLRSRLSSIFTGDQGLFVRRDTLAQAGGYPTQPLMEDIACCRRLKRLHQGKQLSTKLSVSGRKWDREGAFRTVLRMWTLRARYFFGADPAKLATSYYAQRRRS